MGRRSCLPTRHFMFFTNSYRVPSLPETAGSRPGAPRAPTSPGTATYMATSDSCPGRRRTRRRPHRRNASRRELQWRKKNRGESVRYKHVIVNGECRFSIYRPFDLVCNHLWPQYLKGIYIYLSWQVGTYQWNGNLLKLCRRCPWWIQATAFCFPCRKS